MVSAAVSSRVAGSGRRPAGLPDCRAAVIASAAKQSRAWQGARGGHRRGFRCGSPPYRGKCSRASQFAGLPRRYAPRSDSVRCGGVRGTVCGRRCRVGERVAWAAAPPSLRAQRSNPGRAKALEVAIGMASAAVSSPVAGSGRTPADLLDCRVATLLAVTVCGATVPVCRSAGWTPVR